MRKTIYIAALTLSVLIPLQSYSQAIAMRKEIIDKDPAPSRKNETTFTFIVNAHTIKELKNELMQLETSLVRNHTIGRDVAKRIRLFEETYTYFSKAAPGAFSDQKVIHKPVIYHCVNSIEKYYRKQLRIGDIQQEEANKQLCEILDTAIILFNCNTDKFDKALNNAKSAADMTELFNQVQIVKSEG